MAGNNVTLTFAGDTRRLSKSFDDVGAGARKAEGEVNRAGKGIQSSFDSTWSKGAAGAAAGGALIGAVLMDQLGTAIERSKTDALLAAQLGAGTEIAAVAGEAAGDLYARGVVSSVEDANAAVKAAVQNALVLPDATSADIEEVAAKVAYLAMTMEEDAGRVSAAVSQMIRTGMVDSAEEGFDVLQRALELGLNRSNDLLDSFVEYGTQFRNLGIDGPAALGLVNQGLQAGARDADVVIDTLKEFSIEAVQGGEKVAKGYERLGIDADVMFKRFGKGGETAAAAFDETLDALRAVEDPIERNSIAIDLFGTKAEDMGQALYALDLSTATEGLDGLAGAADRAGESLEDSSGAQLERFKRRMEEGLLQAAELWTGFANFMFDVYNNAWAKSTRVTANGVDFIKRVPGAIARAFSGLGASISQPFDAGFNAIRNTWNALLGGKGFTLPSWLPNGWGGRGFTLPYFHTGGVVSGAFGEETMAVLRAGERVTGGSNQSAAGAPTVIIRGDGSRLARLLLELMREAISDAGGDPVRVLAVPR